jgi:hypothetical protein
MAANQSQLNPELVQWLNERQQSLQIKKTTVTPSGTTIDWVPIESQVASGKIATAPPAPPARVDDPRHPAKPVTFELDDTSVERGPEGTVPIVRPDLSQLTKSIALDDYLTKRGGLRVNRNRSGKVPADPSPAGYFHNMVSQDGLFYGWDGAFNVWDPAINIPGGGDGTDHSILQVWLQTDNQVQQSVEGGLTVDKSLNGDLLPHIFTYYTTNAYAKDGNNLGGYNRQHKGWVQYSSPTTTGRVVYPGMAITSISVFDGPQYDLPMKFQLYQEPGTNELNWWVSAEGVWMGYYPASLFTYGLGTEVTWIGAGGEVDTDRKNPEITQDQMGSGSQAAAGWNKAAYLRNLRVQSDLNGTMVNSDGIAASDVAAPGGADPYTIVVEMNSATAWGSYAYVGGPTPPTDVLATWLTNDRPLPKGVWDGQEWGTQHSRASNDRFLLPAGGAASSIRFVVSGTPQNPNEISFNVAIDRSGSDPTCWTGLGNNSVVELEPILQHLGLTLQQANDRGFYICKVQGATQPFDVSAELAG